MQVNPVHALIGLLRNEAQRGILGREQKLQLNALADILLQSKDAKDRLTALEEAIAKGEIKQAPATDKPRVARPGWPDFEHEAQAEINPRDFSIRVGNKTSDAINRAMTEQHGRSWNSYPSNDNSGTGAVNTARDESRASTYQKAYYPSSQMPPGFAFPFKPTAEDVQHALKTGQGWPPELGEEVRLRILRETTRQERDDAAVSYPFWPYVMLVVLAAAVVLWIL